jgi:carbonic anhydrase
MASPRAVLVLFVAVAASSVAFALGQAPAGPDYSYVPGTKLGPENWAKLSPQYSACNGGAPGRKQSPIDIVTRNAVPKPDLDSLNRTYDACDATLINNGKEISASPRPIHILSTVHAVARSSSTRACSTY